MPAKWIFISSSIAVISLSVIFWIPPKTEDRKSPSQGLHSAHKRPTQQADHSPSNISGSMRGALVLQQTLPPSATSPLPNTTRPTYPVAPTQRFPPTITDSLAQNKDRSSKIVKSPVVAPLAPIQAPQLSTVAPEMASGHPQFSGASWSSSTQNPAMREIVQNVPEGAKVPTVFYDTAEKPLPQQKALSRIAEEFEKNVSEVPPGLTQQEVWETARLIADERYITLFGYQAFNQYHLKAAKEALKEKRARAATGQTAL